VGAKQVGALIIVSGLWLSGPMFGQAAELVPTPETGIGVWYAPGAPATRDLWRPGDPGERLILRVRVLDTKRAPIANALVELWHADSLGTVHAQRYRASHLTGTDGSFEVSTVLPGYIWGPRHVHFVVTHPDYPQLITRIFFKRDPVVAESEYPELAIFLEDALAQGEPTLFGDVELVLPAR
jgi:protocatechuate 3,4-dioxygenase beta subunit